VRGTWPKRGKDVMGYALAPVLSLYTAAEIKAARLLASAAGYGWDVVGTDPRVTGRRFLRDAAICLRGSLEYPLHPKSSPCARGEKYPSRP